MLPNSDSAFLLTSIPVWFFETGFDSDSAFWLTSIPISIPDWFFETSFDSDFTFFLTSNLVYFSRPVSIRDAKFAGKKLNRFKGAIILLKPYFHENQQFNSVRVSKFSLAQLTFSVEKQFLNNSNASVCSKAIFPPKKLIWVTKN